ncbi:MAG: hypothetical protein FD180_1479 [Planctomycetota bacterium]|nr:MAG: hypothetical protein FD180_1479 [Planctomycetota bacterium]
MLGPLNLSADGAEKYRRAEAARQSFDFELASKLYEQLSKQMVRTSWQANSRRAFACAVFCHALAILKTTGSWEETRGILARSAKEFELASDQGNLRRVRAYQKYCQGYEEAGDLDFEEAGGSFREAAHRFSLLGTTFVEERERFEAIAAESLLEAAVNETMHFALLARFDDCRMSLADATRALEALRSLPRWTEFAPLYESRFEFAVALAPYLRGQLELRVLNTASASAFLKEALPHLKNAVDLISNNTHQMPDWKPRALQYGGALASCLASIRHAEIVEEFLERGVSEAPTLLREVRQLYDAAAEQHSLSGTAGILGAKSSAVLRDFMEGLALAIEKRIEPECFQLPDFGSIVASPEMRKLLERDYREVIACYLAGAWKMSIVCAGGMIEALLVDMLQANWPKVQSKCKAAAGKDSKEALAWTFDSMIDRCEEAGLLSPGNVYVSDSLRQFRNHVHAKVEMRSKAAIGREEALSAIRAVRRFVASRKTP